MYSLDLKLFKKSNNLNQKDAASYFECDQSFISQIETGKSKVPDEFISKILADKLILKDSLTVAEDDFQIKGNQTNMLIEIIKTQADGLNAKDEQIGRLLSIIENQLKQ